MRVLQKIIILHISKYKDGLSKINNIIATSLEKKSWIYLGSESFFLRHGRCYIKELLAQIYNFLYNLIFASRTYIYTSLRWKTHKRLAVQLSILHNTFSKDISIMNDSFGETVSNRLCKKVYRGGRPEWVICHTKMPKSTRKKIIDRVSD